MKKFLNIFFLILIETPLIPCIYYLTWLVLSWHLFENVDVIVTNFMRFHFFLLLLFSTEKERGRLLRLPTIHALEEIAVVCRRRRVFSKKMVPSFVTKNGFITHFELIWLPWKNLLAFDDESIKGMITEICMCFVFFAICSKTRGGKKVLLPTPLGFPVMSG